MKFKAEIFDKLQFLFKTYKFNDHVLHCVINFDGKINVNVLKKALLTTLDVVPILKTRYVENVPEPYWEELPNIDFDNILTLTTTEDEFNRLLTSKIDEAKEVQVKAFLLKSENHKLAILMNHMICDAAGFKKYLYTLCDIYSKLIANIDYSPTLVLDGNRSIKLITNEFSLINKFKSFITQNHESNGFIDLKFPMKEEESFNAFILTHTLDSNRFKNIITYCKSNKFTINDVLLAAFYRVIYKILNNQKLSISVAVDMRKHLKSKNINSLCNLTSTVISTIECKGNDTFYDTAKKVNANMNLKKKNFIGLNGLVKISLLFKVLSYTRLKKLLSSHFNNPLIGMTNIGIIDSKRLCFNGAKIQNTFICGSIKYKPYFQLAATTYDNTITLSINLYGTLEDKKNINDFFTIFDNELLL